MVFAKKFQQKVYEFTLKGKHDILKIIRELCKKSYGIYQAHGIVHHKTQDLHTHITVSLRDKPNFTGNSLNTYFELPQGSTPPRPVTSGKSIKKKLDTMAKYYTDEAKHPGEIQDPLVTYKYIQIGTADQEPKSQYGKALKAYVQDGKSLMEQYDVACWDHKAFLMKEYDTLTKMFSSHKRMLTENKPKEFPMNSFKSSYVKGKVTTHDFSLRHGNRKKQCLILQGKSNTGKTKLAKARFNKPLVVRHIDKLKKFDPLRHDGIIFDDMSFAHYPRETVLSLMDMDDDSDINVKNSMVTIPAGHPRIFTTNRKMYAMDGNGYDKSKSFLPEPLDCWNQGAKPLNDEALSNRYTLLEVHEKLYA